MTPRYVAIIGDRAGARKTNEYSSFTEFVGMVRVLREKVDPRDQVLIFSNLDRVDLDFDGLTPEEREILDEIMSPPAAAAAEPGVPYPRRNLRDYPELKRIDGRIRALGALRPNLQNADREAWSVVDDIKREALGLFEAINSAKAKARAR